MSVRVVARIRPLLKTEREIDIILRPGASNPTLPSAAKSSDENTTLKTQKDICDRPNVVRIPNPKNEGEQYSFQFNSVYDDTVGQQEFFDAEVAPTVKHLFNGFDITLFAYGVTGTGKTHTMRGGKSLADRGVIPRLLSGIYRRSRKMEKDSQGATKVNVVMSYYEIYNDKVFDLFEPPEKRTPSGLPLRDSGDLAGSEDNRRTDNGKERMVESASINKSLFVLAQCPRVENEPMFKGPPRLAPGLSAKGSSIKRQPLRPLTASLNANIVPPAANGASKPSDGKPTKSFMVYTDKSQAKQQAQPALAKASPLKRKSGNNLLPLARPSKIARVANEASTRCTQESNSVSAAKIEEMVEKKVAQILAARARDKAETSRGALRTQANNINAQLQRRLERLEQRVEGNEDARAEGLSYLLMGKQHQSHGEDKSALKMYQLALPFFPENAKLAQKIEVLQARLNGHDTTHNDSEKAQQQGHKNRRRVNRESAENYDSGDEEYCELEENDSLSDENYEAQGHSRPKPKARKAATRRCHPRTKETGVVDANNAIQSPRTAHILSIINSRNINQIKLLRGVGAKKAEAIVDCLCEMDGNVSDADKSVQIRSLVELGKMKGVGLKTVENMRNAVDVA
ncbi:kinesin-2 subunit [Coccidioides immitis RMSCC 3703]|uniref:Kinesin-2 subunit n=1 Tax=Coccidioides immitis RMSCC 3703 TaxID=454286 RepID=A0A0J8QUZ5_COCIT|nr:kinesin-2 subunit [Coccidioides immitis RMSCC 3703]